MFLVLVIIAVVLNAIYWLAMAAWSRSVTRSNRDSDEKIFTGRLAGWTSTAPAGRLRLRRDSFTIETRSIRRDVPDVVVPRANVTHVRVRAGIGSTTVRFEVGGFGGSDYGFTAWPSAGLREALVGWDWLPGKAD